jgi:chaperonin GroES
MENTEQEALNSLEPIKRVFPDNLAYSLDDAELDKIGGTCVEEYDADVLSRTDFDKRRAGWLKLFAGSREPKNWPWKDASNTHIPLLAYACLQFQARAMEALVPSKNIAKCYSADGRYQDAAKRAENHLNYQLGNEMEEWEEDMDAALMSLPLMGSIYKKTLYDPTLKRNISTMVGVDEFVTDYGCKRLDECMRKTHVLRMPVNNMKIRFANRIWMEQEIPLEASSESVNLPMPEYQQEKDKVNAQQAPDAQFRPIRIFLEQHRNLEINYDPVSNTMLDKDGIERPYVVWVDYETKKVVRITSRLYFDNDRQEYRTMEHFTHYGLIPNPESHYWFGFGHLVDNINETADTLLNQLIDAGTLSNIQGGFILKRAGLKRGQIQFEMGKWEEVDVMTDDIRKAMMPLNFKPPSNVLFTVLGMLQSYVKELTTTADWMAGGLPPSDTAATTMLAVIEQGLKVFSTIQKRCHRSLKRELKKLFILNSMYLDEDVYFAVQDSTSREFKTMKSGKSDYASLIEVVPASDPNITSKAESLIKAQQVLQSVRQSPLTAQDKNAQYIAERNYYEALGVPNIDLFLKQPEPEQPKDIPPIEENAMFMKEQTVPVLPQQNHVDHYRTHEAFLKSPTWSGYITPLGKKITETHMREHLSFAYAQAAQIEKKMAMQNMLRQRMAQGGMNGGEGGVGGSEGMVAEQGNSPVLDEFRASKEGQVGNVDQDTRAYTRIDSKG